jgi:hypothetical protein
MLDCSIKAMHKIGQIGNPALRYGGKYLRKKIELPF